MVLSRSIYKFLKAGPTGLFLFVLVQAGLIPLHVLAQDPIASSLDPKMLYERMIESRELYDYQGILTYEQAGQMQSFEVSSRREGTALDQKLNQLDGPQQEHFLRFDSECMPRQGANVEQFDDYYNFFAIGEVRVAGRLGTEIVLMPVDKYRNGFQFVVDNETGLMLRTVVTAPDRRVVERTQFVSIDFERREETDEEGSVESEYSVDMDSDTVTENTNVDVETSEEVNDSAPEILSQTVEGAETVDATETVEETPIPVAAEASGPQSVNCNYLSIENGWIAGWLPEGFSLLQSSLEEERATMVYGDGITVVSVFIEPVQETFLPPSNAQRGATAIYINYLSTRTNTYLVSVVGEVPMPTAERVFSSLRRQQ